MSLTVEQHALAALIAERIMGETLDWGHEQLLQALAEDGSREANGGRGIFMRCSGCGLKGYGNQIDWSQRCPAPVVREYPLDLTEAWAAAEVAADQWNARVSVHRWREEGLVRYRAYLREGNLAYSDSVYWLREDASTAPLAICFVLKAGLEARQAWERRLVGQEGGAA